MVGTSRNTRRSSRSNRCNPHNAIKLLIQPTKPCKELLRFRIAFSEYLQSSSESVSEPCFFTIRGRHRWGLSLHLGITTRQYSALLLACDLVSTQKPQMVHLPFHVQKQDGEKISSKGMDYLMTPKDTAKLREQKFGTSIWKMMMVSA
eukprot:scaffold15026_cov149-Skeletonema_marinoi.AAC.1